MDTRTLLRALQEVEKRAELVSENDVLATYVEVDSLTAALGIKQDQTEHPLIQRLVDERILHIIKRGWSGKDKPGERYDVLQIDYGCYVHLLGTTSAPQGLLGGDDSDEFSTVMGEVEVPDDDYRAIRRAILDLPSILARIA